MALFNLSFSFANKGRIAGVSSTSQRERIKSRYYQTKFISATHVLFSNASIAIFFAVCCCFNYCTVHRDPPMPFESKYGGNKSVVSIYVTCMDLYLHYFSTDCLLNTH